MNFKNEIAQFLSKNIDMNLEDIQNLLEVPANSEMGDFAFPCFKLAKEYKKAPPIIAKEISEKLATNNIVSKIIPTGPYLNFFVNKEIFAKEVLAEVFEKSEDYGYVNIGNGEVVVLDYSSPNIAKPFHVGHLRSTTIGRALYNIYNKLGYKSYGINYLGDWGTQFGKLITAYKMWGNKEEVEKGEVEELNKLYVKFHNEAEIDDSLNDTARSWMLKMQNGDEEALSLWKWFNEVSFREYDRIYRRLNVTFDSFKGESFYNDKMTPIVEELKEKNLLVKSNGAMVVDLEEFKMPPCLILRSDGGTLYPTRDLAAAKYRHEEYNFVKCIIITAFDQNLHFAQWFKVLELMGYDWASQLIHVPFGLVNLENGKLSTRSGNVVLMEDLLDESINKTLQIINDKNPNLENKETIANQVGIGAVIFDGLYNSRIKDIVFSWEKMLSFDGETGPYVQYCHARANSVLKKSGTLNLQDVDYTVLTDDASFNLIKLIYDYPSKIVDAGNKNEPYIIARHLIDIAQGFNKFYHDVSILVDDVKIKNSRLSLVWSVKTIIKSGLEILGIDAPDEM